MLKKRKFVVVTGGVLSGLGKGLFVSSLGKLLQSRGYKVVPLKIDPYVNVDAGTMNPIEHGEVFVLDDGSEVDMDLGTYERFLDIKLNKDSNITTGKIFKKVIEKERRGDYLGKTVQLIPFVTGELKKEYRDLYDNNSADVVLIEIGGTIGDIENQIFLESVRELSLEEEVMFIHCTLVPVMGVVGEQKTKPTQQNIRLLREIGIIPNMIFCRSEKPIEEEIKNKISLFCNVSEERIISGPDLNNIYEIPLVLDQQCVAEKVLSYLKLEPRRKNLFEWKDFVRKLNNPSKSVNIALIGKYTHLKDSYVSVIESLVHASGNLGCKINMKLVESSDIEKGIDLKILFNGVDGILVPGGFGKRGIEGKISAIKYARENNIPFLGLCLGFQLAVIEYARHVCLLNKANSSEFAPEVEHKVIDILEDQKNLEDKGGTMRLGVYEADLMEDSLISFLYGSNKAFERHRHRYEVNANYIKNFEDNGMLFSGKSLNNSLMEFLEIPNHRFFIATQAHPEFTSRPLNPNPLFLGFVKSCLGQEARTISVVAS